ncbi:hypothetical protein [Pseudomarimonas arenosa]|uniref:Uncharacterized protein n=1 Tax=Pseudomarimonas arenosa TaxID=2774145 RepID=A0AAW3ZL20_9GAMM|nr:hypothetical protein [Pseudomarimonas arenosa]MBD8525879.1 hypothetical protein [Pseudomarimonas arenosa]
MPSTCNRREFVTTLFGIGGLALLPGSVRHALGNPNPRLKGAADLPLVRLRCVENVVQAGFCFGQALAPGVLPAGWQLHSDQTSLQTVVLNRWPDGSAKWVVLAGQVDLLAEQTLDLNLSRVPTVSASGLTEADLATALPTVLLGFAGHSVQLNSLLGIASQDLGGSWSAGRVRTVFAGPECSSWQYYAPLGDDPQLSAWFEVRLWRNQEVELLAWIENGRLQAPNPGSRAGLASLSIGGTQRYAGSLDIPHHARCLLASGRISHRSATTAAVEVLHDTEHWQGSGLVPSYYGQTPTNAALFGSLYTEYAPLNQGGFPAAMGSTGYHASIGLLPEWEAAFFTSGGDQRALQAVLANAAAAGRYAIHYRDETSNQPLRFSSYPHLCLSSTLSGVSSAGSSSTNHTTPANAGSAPPTWATSHHPSVGYLAYLLSGWQYFLQEIQFSATLGFLKQSDLTRQYSAGILRTDSGSNTTRGAAWSLRTLTQAACATPDDDPIRSELLASLAANVDYYHQRYIETPSCPQGFCTPYSDYSSGDGVYLHAAWMEDFLTAAFGYLLSLRLLTGPSAARLNTFFAWKAQSIVGRFGAQGSLTEYNYRDAAQYTIAVAPSDSVDWAGGSGPWYADFGALYADTLGHANESEPGDTLRGAYYPESTSYWGNLQPALAYAVTHRVPGAETAYQRMTGASNWAQILAGWNQTPVWGVRPSSAPFEVFSNGFEAEAAP